MENVLVSVVVLAYNSSATVLETLDSIKNQTYKNIELIITDDASLDKTRDICNEWISKNPNEFVRIELVSSVINTGISSNANRGVSHSNGIWLKLIAADDKLLPTCIEQNIAFVQKNPNSSIIFSKFKGIGDEEAAKKSAWMNCGVVLNTFSIYELKTLLYQRNCLPAATAFYTRALYDAVGGFEETIPYLEDWPFWIKALDKGFIFGYFDQDTVEYRFSSLSISQEEGQTVNSKFHESSKKAVKFASDYLANLNVFAWYYKVTTYNSLTVKSIGWKLLHYTNFINPFYYHNLKVYRKFKNTYSEI